MSTECNIHIEHCDAPGFLLVAEYIGNEVKKQVPATSVEIVKGRPDSFEVTVNGFLVCSRLQSKSLAIPDKVIEEIVAMANGKDPEFVSALLDESKDCTMQ